MATTGNGKKTGNGKMELFRMMHCSKCVYGMKHTNTCAMDEETITGCMIMRCF